MLARFTTGLRSGAGNSVDQAEEQDLVTALRARTENEQSLTPEQCAWLTDECLCRYLRARKYNSDKAAAMLYSTLSWRVSNDVEHMLPVRRCQKFEVIRNEGLTGKMFVLPILDKYGRAIILMRPGLENSADVDGNLLFLQYTLERASVLCDRAQGGSGKFVVLIDFAEGQFSLRRAPSLSTSRATLHMIQDHYPERLGKAVLFDAPMFFFPVFKALKPFIDPVTYDKIHFASRSSAVTDAKHIADLDATAIPTEYGGRFGYKFTPEDYFENDGKLS